MKEVLEGYFVTRDGRVWSGKTNRFLKPRPLPTGYLRISAGMPQKDHYIHRLVASAFISTIEGKDFVNHKNGEKSDNRVENLEWVTCKENSNHMIEVLGKGYGESKPEAKLTNEQVREIKIRLSEGERPTHLAKEFKVSRKAICNIKNKKTWLRVGVD